jgi:hypothetical protein
MALPRSEVIASVLETEPVISDGDLPALGTDALRLLMASLKGIINLKPGEMRIASDIFRKLVPDAPKSIRMEHSVAPEDYIRDAVGGNEESFKRLQEHAGDYAKQVEVINAEFYEVLEGKL